MLRNFSFVLKDRVAGCAAPGAWDRLEEDLDMLREEGITALVSLTEEPLDTTPVRRAGLDYLHEPIPDFHPPSLAQVRRFVEFIDTHLKKKNARAVAVHCYAGRGRTGTMLACYLVSTGVSADEAIRTVRRLRPGSIETRDQERAVAAWQAWLQEMGMTRKPKAAAKTPTPEGGRRAHAKDTPKKRKTQEGRSARATKRKRTSRKSKPDNPGLSKDNT